MPGLHYIFEGSQSYNLDPNTCYVKSSEGVRITNFKVLQALSNLGTSKILLFRQPKTSILLPFEEGTIQNSSVASFNTPCCSGITTHVNELSCDEPRPGSSKDMEDSSQEKQESLTEATINVHDTKQVLLFCFIFQGSLSNQVS
jgi:hypothetical protein